MWGAISAWEAEVVFLIECMAHRALAFRCGGIGWHRIKAATCGFYVLLLLAFISEVLLLLEVLLLYSRSAAFISALCVLH
jgi:hypothetical protein